MGTSRLPRSGWRATYKLKSQERDASDDEASSVPRTRGPVWRDQDPEPRRTPATPARVARPSRGLAQTPAVVGAYPRTPAPMSAPRAIVSTGKGKAKAESTPRRGADAESAWTAVTGKKLPTPVWADISSSGTEPPPPQQQPTGPSSSNEESPVEPQPRKADLNARLAHFSSVAGTPHVPGHLWSVSSPSTPIPAATPSREPSRAQDNRRLAASSATPPTPRPPGHFAVAPTPPTPAPTSRPDLWLAKSQDEHAPQEEDATSRDRRTSTPPRPAKVRFDDVDAPDRSFSTGHATSFRDAEGEHEDEDTTRESIAEARVNSLLGDLADAVKDLRNEPRQLQELVDECVSPPSRSLGRCSSSCRSFSVPTAQPSNSHRAILSALARSSSTTAADRAQILSRLRSSDQSDRELSLQMDEIRRSVEGMGGRLADAVREGFREEGGKRKRWLVTVVAAEAVVVWLMFTCVTASVRAPCAHVVA